MISSKKIILKSGKDQSVFRRHPWIFSGAIKKIHGHASDRADDRRFDNKDTFLARGHYQPGSIAVRILTFSDTIIDADFYRERINDAVEYRRETGILNLPSTNVFRLIHAEGDNMPGLIVDLYNDIAVLQAHSAGMYYQRELLAEILMSLENLPVSAVYDKSNTTLTHKAGIEHSNGFLKGKPADDLVVLDPPAFAKHQNVLHNALQGYKRLNIKAIEKITPGGILFTFSCSQVVNRENFRKSVFAAAASAGRKVRIIKQLSQTADHPVNIFHPESEYLKGLVLYIE